MSHRTQGISPTLRGIGVAWSSVARSPSRWQTVPYARPMRAAEIIERLGLQPHPEGGWYAETWRGDSADGDRASGSAIYFLLRAGERSHWHRVDAAEIWHYYAGDPRELRIAAEGPRAETTAIVLGVDLEAGQRPQFAVPAGAWQAARSLGDWTLVGCTVSPAFDFAGFELAPEGWEPSATYPTTGDTE